MDYRWVLGLGLVLAVALAVFVAPFASSSPDGLERVAIDHNFTDKAQETSWKLALAPDYVMPGASSEGSATALSGLVGTLLVFAVAVLLMRLVRWRNSPTSKPTSDPCTRRTE